MLVNLSNHPSSEWPTSQREAALRLESSIVDVPFPDVDPRIDGVEFEELAQETVRRVMAAEARSAMVQGEPTMVFMVVRMLREARVRCYAATTERDSFEELAQNGLAPASGVSEFLQVLEPRRNGLCAFENSRNRECEGARVPIRASPLLTES